MRSPLIEPLVTASLEQINNFNEHNSDTKTFIKPKELKILLNSTQLNNKAPGEDEISNLLIKIFQENQ